MHATGSRSIRIGDVGRFDSAWKAASGGDEPNAGWRLSSDRMGSARPRGRRGQRRVPFAVTLPPGDRAERGTAARSLDSAAGEPRPQARLFLALWPTPQVRARLLDWRDAFDWPAGAAIVAPERLHVTLHFIGPVGREQVDTVADALAVPTGAFELRFGRPELWPGGLAVLGPLSCPEGLRALHRRLGDALHALGLPTEARPYRPHVTFARKAAGAALRHEPASLRWRVRSHALVESRPGRAGGYVVLRRYG